MDELYRKLLAQLEEGQDTVLAFITEGDGSIPRTTGAYMLVGREGRIFGTIGGGNLEYQAVLHAQELVQEKKSEYREYDLGTGEGKGLGMVCGGRVKVCFYFMNGAHGEAESLAQALAAQEQYCSYWIFFALDGTGIRVLETLARANRDLGTTVVIITHNAGIAAMAHRVFHFLDGRIARIEVNAAPVDPAGISW